MLIKIILEVLEIIRGRAKNFCLEGPKKSMERPEKSDTEFGGWEATFIEKVWKKNSFAPEKNIKKLEGGQWPLLISIELHP